MFVRYIYSIYIYNIYTGITGRIFLFAIDSHLVGPVNIQRILEITPGHSVSDLYTQVIPIVSYSSQPDTLFLPPNNSKNYFQEGNIPLHSPIHYSPFLWIECPALNTFDSKILRERRRWEKRFASDGRKKKKNWPTEERISDRVGSRLFLFFFIFHTRFVGQVDQRGISPREDRRETRSRGNRYYTSAGQSWKSIEGWKGRRRKRREMVGCGALRPQSECTQGNVGLIPKTFESPRFCSRPRAIYSMVTRPPFPNHFLSFEKWTRENKKGKKKIG